MAIMVDISEGVWCKKCQTFHPTLWWHTPYSEYDTKEIRTERWRNIARKFRISDTEVTELIAENEKYRDYQETDEQAPCVICGTETYFVCKKTGHHVCRDECLYADSKRDKRI